jgi:hypothetical protein
MVPKADRLCRLSVSQLAADRLAAAAGLTLALHWPFGPWPLDHLPLRRRSRRTPVTLGIGRYRHSSLLARDGARNHSSTGRSNARRKRRFHHGESKLDDRLTRWSPRHKTRPGEGRPSIG